MDDEDKKLADKSIEQSSSPTPAEEKELAEAEKAVTPAEMYQNTVDVGTEEMGPEDRNSPVLKIVQTTTQDIEGKKEGWFHRSDTDEQLETVEVCLVHVSTKEVENYDRTGWEKVKVYFGFYAGTTDPFRMYVRGWSLSGHRNFQTEVVRIKKQYRVPMFALKVRLFTEKQSGTSADTGKPYTTHRLVFEILKNKTGKPEVEMEPGRIAFLFEAARRFKEIAKTTTAHDEEQNKEPLPWEEGSSHES